MQEGIVTINGEIWDIIIAESFWERFRGLMGKKSLPEHTALWIVKCGSIHCCFMKFPIDVVYLSKDEKVLKTETVKPWRIGSFVRGADSVLEMNKGEAANIKPGSTVDITFVTTKTDEK